MNDPLVSSAIPASCKKGGQSSKDRRDIFRFKAQLLASIAFSIFVILGVFTHWFRIYHRESEIAQTRSAVHHVESEWKNNIEKETRTLRESMDILFRKLDWALVTQEMDRDRLLVLLRPYLANILEINGIEQFQLILPHGTCFLRVHDPLRYGDLLHLSTVRKATHTGEESWGVDISPLGASLLNYLRPVGPPGKPALFVLLGKSLGTLPDYLKERSGNDLLMAFNKRFSTREIYESGRNSFGLIGDWDLFKQFVVVKRTVSTIPDGLGNYLDDTGDSGPGPIFELYGENRVWSCGISTIPTIDDPAAAKLVVLRDVTADRALMGRSVQFGVIFISSVVLFLIFTLYFILTRLENRLVDAVEKLESAEEARRYIEENLSATLHSIGDGVIRTDTDGRVEEMNSMAQTITGWTLNEAQAMTVDGIFGSGSEWDIQNLQKQVTDSGKAYTITQERLRRRDGIDIPVTFSIAPIRSPNRGDNGWVFVLRDVTEEHQLRDALREEKDFQQTLLDNISVGVVVIDPATHRIEHANPAAVAMFGAPLSVIQGRRCHQFLCPQQKGACPITDLGKEVESAERPMLCADGSHRATLKTVKRIRIHGEEKLIESFIDITELKKAEADLQKLSAAIEQSPTSIVITDLKGTIEYVNPKFTEVTGYTRQEAIGENPRMLKSGNLSKQAYENMWATLGSGNEWHGEFHNKRKNGELFWEQASISPVRDGQGRIHHFVAVKEDITHRKQVEEELVRSKADLIELNTQIEAAIEKANTMALDAEMANLAKSQFLANMSHEIRTPLNGVLGMLQLLQKTDLDERQKRCCKVAYDSAETLLLVLNDILDLSKIEADKLELESYPFNLRTLVEEIAQLLDPLAAEKGVEVIVDYKSGTPTSIVGDGLRVRQILMNLVGNAVKFTDHGFVRIQVESQIVGENGAEASPQIHIRVRDTGIGMSEKVQKQLFQLFFQADGSITRQFGGTGLGLAISRKLIHLMGGDLKLESRLREGTTFHCVLPWVPSDVETAAENPSSMESLNGTRVLVVDDIPESREALMEMLKEFGMISIPASDGLNALEKLKQLRPLADPTMLLVDVEMPGMDGFALLDGLDTPAPGDIRPVMMLSSKKYEKDAVRCRQMGPLPFLVKPVRRSDLLKAVLSAMGFGGGTCQEAVSDTVSVPKKSLNILLAEDNPVNQEIAVGLLEGMGHRVHVAENGQIAVKAAGDHRFDIILMDVQMPEMDGFEATRRIRKLQQDSSRRIPIIAMTAHASGQDGKRCMNEGMDDHIGKPINLGRLEEILNQWSGDVSSASNVRIESDQRPEPCVTEPIRTAPTPIDVSDLLSRCMGKKNIAERVLDKFRKTLPQTFVELRESLSAGDLDPAARHAHAIRGAAANISATALSVAAAGAEQALRDGNTVQAQMHIDDMETNLTECLSAIPEILLEMAMKAPIAGTGASKGKG